MVVNASEERTAKQLMQRIEAITNTESLLQTKEGKKPALLIFDEVDGSLESENKGAI